MSAIIPHSGWAAFHSDSTNDSQVSVYFSVNEDSYPFDVRLVSSYLKRAYPEVSFSLEISNQEHSVDASIWGVRSISWNDLTKQLNEKYLRSLQQAGVSERVIELSRQSLDVKRNREVLSSRIEHSSYTKAEKLQVRQALRVATIAHLGQVAARDQDREGLFHIPYVNHPICMAIHAVELGLSATATQLALLHDVVEDTEFTFDQLAGQFSPELIDGLRRVTRLPGESRSEFLHRLQKNRGETKVVKALDRFDNLVRSFAIADVSYIERILRENKSTYHQVFHESPELEPLKQDYLSLHSESAKKSNLPENLGDSFA